MTSLFKGTYTDPDIELALAQSLMTMVGGFSPPVVVICIGTDANIADSLGPLVGTMLVEGGSSLPVYGTLNQPIHARNLMAKVQAIKQSYPGFMEMAIDASAGKKEELGIIEVKNGGVYPGKALQKRLPQVGHISIVGKVGVVQGIRNYGHLTEGRLGMVYRMAQVIARGILKWEREQVRT